MDRRDQPKWSVVDGPDEPAISSTHRSTAGRWMPSGAPNEASSDLDAQTTTSLANVRAAVPTPSISGATTLSEEGELDPAVFGELPFGDPYEAGATESASFGPLASDEDLFAAQPVTPTGQTDRVIPGATQFDTPDSDAFLDEIDPSADARRNAIEWVVVLVAAVLLALLLRAFLLQAFWIPSPSMTSTLLVKDRVLVNKLSYRFQEIDRGEIVVFHRTDDEILQNPSLPADVIKRVIGLPGDTVEFRDNVLYVDDVALDEPYLDEGTITGDFGPFVVPEEHVFVMGDNREHSQDSRSESTGPIPIDRIVGRAFVLFWPIDRAGAL